MSLLVCVLVVMELMSCRPSGKQAVLEKSESDSGQRKAEMKKSVLSKEQIIEIANRAARQRGRDPERCVIGYDEGNVFWRKVARGPWHELEGHDFQAVGYDYREPIASGTLWVLVDRNTGEVLSAMAQP